MWRGAAFAGSLACSRADRACTDSLTARLASAYPRIRETPCFRLQFRTRLTTMNNSSRLEPNWLRCSKRWLSLEAGTGVCATVQTGCLADEDRNVSAAARETQDVGISMNTWTMSRLERGLWLSLLWLVATLYVCATTVADPDLWGHTLYGLRALELGLLVEPTDPFSYTAFGERWVNHEWLTELQFGWLWKQFGSLGLVVWRDLLMIGVFAVAARSFRDAKASVGAAVILWLYTAQCLAGFCVFVRPQVATFFLFALTLWILRRQWGRPRTRTIWLLPLLSLIWVNLHGGFLAGVCLIGLFAAAAIIRAIWFRFGRTWGPADGRELAKQEGIKCGEQAGNAPAHHALSASCGQHQTALSGRGQADDWAVDRASGALREDAFDRRWPWRLVVIACLSLLATLVNPYGLGLYEMLWTHLVPEQAVREWQPLWAARQAPFYYLPFILLAMVLGGSRRWQWIDLVVLLAVGFQAVSHIRHIALLSIAILVLMPGPLSDALARLFRNLSASCQGDDRFWRRGLGVVGAVLLIVLLEVPATLRIWREGAPPWGIAVESTRNSPGIPLRAIEVLQREKIEGNLLTAYGWGQYVIWHRFPENRVGFDGRYRTVYPRRVEEAFLAFRDIDPDSHHAATILNDYPTQIILWPTIERTCDYLAKQPDWIEVYADEQARLFVRDLPQFARLIERVRQQQLTTSNVPLFTRFPGGPVSQPVPRQIGETVNQTLHSQQNLIPKGNSLLPVKMLSKVAQPG